jgi:hypothetical protein
MVGSFGFLLAVSVEFYGGCHFTAESAENAEKIK